MDSNTVRNVAIWEVTNNLPPSNTNNLSYALREVYETERTFQEKAKEGSNK